MTAGLLMFVVRPERRGAYQTLFRDRLVRKTYEAIAPLRPPAGAAAHRAQPDRQGAGRHLRAGGARARQRGDAASSWSSSAPALGRYRLTPATGRTHQLRLHMSGLGVPILGDDFYPVLLERPLDDFGAEIGPESGAESGGRFGAPLQLLAATLEFTDPVTGAERRFRTRRRLAAWPDG